MEVDIAEFVTVPLVDFLITTIAEAHPSGGLDMTTIGGVPFWDVVEEIEKETGRDLGKEAMAHLA